VAERSPFDEDTPGEASELPTVPDADATVAERVTCFTRGLNPRAALAWVRATYGEEGIVNVLDSLEDEDAFALGGRNGRLVSARAWVPFLAHARLLAIIDATFGSGDFGMLRAVGRYMGFHDFPVVARPLLRLASPGFFLDKAMKLWRMYHSHGRWEIVRTANTVRAALVDHPEHHAAFCATFLGWMDGALSLTGALSIESTETRCAALGARCCSFEVTWTDRSGSRERVPRPPT
jgi:hypothetical protein